MRAGARERSFWGWGWADRFPDDATRAGLAGVVEALLGVRGITLRPVPRLSDVRIPDPRIPAPGALAEIVTDDREARIRHTYGRAYPDLVRAFRGDFAAAPDLVAHPGNESDVGAVMAWCRAERVALIPYGGGTSVVGGVEAAVGAGYRGTLSLDLGRLDRVLEVDPMSRAARIQAGATGHTIEGQLGKHGVTLRHFPQSFEHSTLGGWIATRAGGHFATLYTHIDDLVESVRMVTPTGVWESRRLPASGAGPSPDRLVLGSEGVLGVITEAWVRVHSRPTWRARANVLFERFSEGVAAARAIAQAGLYPANCRLLDTREAQLNGVATHGKHVLLLAFESADHPLEAWIERAVELARAHGGECDRIHTKRGQGDAASSWKDAFFAAPYHQSVLVSLGIVADTFETACTWDRFEPLRAAVERAVHTAMELASGERGILTCRFTHVYPDGPAAYFTFLVRAPRGRDELEVWREIKRAASDALLANGGTITHHHAVGRTHRPWYELERPEPFGRALAAAKQAVDPEWILNPGVLLEPPDPRKS